MRESTQLQSRTPEAISSGPKQHFVPGFARNSGSRKWKRLRRSALFPFGGPCNSASTPCTRAVAIQAIPSGFCGDVHVARALPRRGDRKTWTRGPPPCTLGCTGAADRERANGRVSETNFVREQNRVPENVIKKPSLHLRVRKHRRRHLQPQQVGHVRTRPQHPRKSQHRATATPTRLLRRMCSGMG